jgi:MFS family permease
VTGVVDRPAPPPVAVPRRNLFFTVVPPIMLPVFLAAADGTVVATALPAIAASFGNVERLSWLVVANLIASTIATPAYGRLGDMVGRRRTMLLALAIFMLAAVLCALSGSFNALLAARVLQGLGGGGLMTLSQALVGEHVPPRRRGSYQGYLSSCIFAGSALGPVGGGLITQWFGWHAVFLAYLPLGALAILLVLRLPEGARGRGPASFDAGGMLLLGLFIVPLLLAVSELQQLTPAALPGMAGLLLLAGAAFAALLWQQQHVRAPLLAPSLLRLPAFWRADVLGACSGASLTAMVTFLPIYYQIVTGASPAQSGLLLIPMTVSTSVGSVLTGWLISWTGRTTVFPAFGLAITACTLAAAAVWAPVLSNTQLAWLLAAGGVCQGTAMVTAQIIVQHVAGPHQLGSAAASVQLSRSLGSAFGAAAAGAVLFGVLSLRDPHAATLFFEMVRRGPAVLALLPADQQALVQDEIGAAFRGVFLLVACFSCTIVGMAVTLPVRRL